jgi:hypothetical protein
MDDLRPIVGGFSERIGETRGTLAKLRPWQERALAWQELVASAARPAPKWSPPQGSGDGGAVAWPPAEVAEAAREPARAGERT